MVEKERKKYLLARVIRLHANPRIGETFQSIAPTTAAFEPAAASRVRKIKIAALLAANNKTTTTLLLLLYPTESKNTYKAWRRLRRGHTHCQTVSHRSSRTTDTAQTARTRARARACVCVGPGLHQPPPLAAFHRSIVFKQKVLTKREGRERCGAATSLHCARR